MPTQNVGVLVKNGPDFKLQPQTPAPSLTLQDYSSTECPEACAGCEHEAVCSMAQEEDAPEPEGLRTSIARAIWSVAREYEDRCDYELEDIPRSHPVWEEADAVVGVLSQRGIV